MVKYILAAAVTATTSPFSGGALTNAANGAYGGTAPTTTIIDTLKNVGNAVFSVLGLVFFFLMLYAGILWMTAAGEPKKVTKAKEILSQSVIGLIICICAYGISFFVMTWALVLAI